MPSTTSRTPARLTVTVLLLLLAGGCAGKSSRSTAASQPAPTASTVAPTTTVPPLTSEELAWLKAVAKLQKTMEKTFSETSVYLTRAKMTSYAAALRGCSRELARIGSPSDRLQPVYALVQKACRTLDKGATCYLTAAGASMADGGVVAGSPEERTQRRALDCAGAAHGNGMNLLGDAAAKGEEVKTELS